VITVCLKARKNPVTALKQKKTPDGGGDTTGGQTVHQEVIQNMIAQLSTTRGGERAESNQWITKKPRQRRGWSGDGEGGNFYGQQSSLKKKSPKLRTSEIS